MKTVGILTFYFADNYGAVLQSYALQNAINSYEGYEAELIAFIPNGYVLPRYWVDDVTYKKYIQKRNVFWTFLKNYCNLSNDTVQSIEENKYDLYCVGSDQVWNPTNTKTNEYLFPNLNNKAKRFSYAASLGLPPENKSLLVEDMKKYLPMFDMLSVREYEHVNMIEQLSGKQCECIVDPTLLLGREEYEPIICKKKLRDKPFIFFFWLVQSDRLEKDAIEMVNMIARKYNLDIVHSLVDMPKNTFVNESKDMYFEGVENFLWYIKNADYVITNSYHGTIFSVMYEKPFYTFIFSKLRSRLDTLGEKLGIKDRLIEQSILIDEINMDVNYSDIYQNLERERVKAYDYLSGALKLVKEDDGLVVDRDRKMVDDTIISERNKEIFLLENESCPSLGITKKDRDAYQYPIVMKYLQNKLRGYSFSDFLRKRNIKRYALYAVTEFTELILRDVEENRPFIIADKAYKKYSSGIDGISVVGVDELVQIYNNRELDIIIICNLFFMNEIFEELQSRGIKLENMISVTQAIYAMTDVK